ncbi:hypothetical protein IT396_03000 [Candidatus Nomurabacteria bacterium]|nr:hypothetical protein [Candidatus Nomurabacteria bacterium]
MVNLIIVVEDKREEQERALEAIKRSLGDVEEISEEKGGRVNLFRDCPSPMVALKSPDGGGTLIHFAATLEIAEIRLNSVRSFANCLQKVGVITDLMFPAKCGGKEEPNGLGIIAKCIEAKLRVVVCSDIDHHDVDWLRPIFPILGKAHPTGDVPVILDKKDWDKAVALLADTPVSAAA